ncbi:hypothetical protein A3G67_04625 [Candidatus Roizmanbacteria bacterium RIFCSPLOWO2_12_FULL_40_12]|uniref:Glycosyl transferase family 1 domain-containing protein n=1 Tax=Candidatus Roizmanbacteria bacterium RIFCSPLOWO2_01_FULL_40_42 TaxID=1802066 RepID=A0A1F7J4M9_9BACT|nr:MAG: hypothetical protein A2779_04525 [Candidatus Roizmanbacteria bacterium RIFCSPHIGHO2_01_FULL_40_98]OGK27340.1 MAG: hypothetical protein A3C31_04850 [Candidatus Roizmanbacteria bacterium RIFCSPHIGHO2_02_FULL_40_53]OGK30788.1 MAG: hypothetical protein A2W49_02190 [Candidatus Roizmanbacteria bacterium RIFCSPHIGHO2_12_41_18]OGK36445.1 MAG: hypothetical protein A3E69_02475 [Candidatus Roizmanbacteria bacterium RIFCSPHIGHO2_12_FULL_40_130]OGK50573.1 MAG: hypothetical protein A3B50_02205 [Candi
MKKKKVAIVYDWIDKWGGVERVLLSLRELFPNAQFFTSYVDLKKAQWASELPITSSFIQKLPSIVKRNRVLSSPFYPYAFESFDFSLYDLVISVSSSFAKGIVTSPNTLHILYLLTPTRFLWVNPEQYLTNSLFRRSARFYRMWDFAAAQRPDFIISISEAVKKRSRQYYKRSSEVIYPPFDTSYWTEIKNNKKKETKSEKFFLIVSRLEPYKNVELAINVFNKRGVPLVIVGQGTLEKKLKAIASPNIKFLKNISDSELVSLYRSAKALIISQEEDFGYVALEAQFFGLPVISLKKGGSLETVIEGKTGLFFDRPNEKSLADALERFERISYNLRRSTKTQGPEQVKQFDKANFSNNLLQFITSKTL